MLHYIFIYDDAADGMQTDGMVRIQQQILMPVCCENTQPPKNIPHSWWYVTNHSLNNKPSILHAQTGFKGPIYKKGNICSDNVYDAERA